MSKREADTLLPEYQYEPLQGQLWIRVIQLQPSACFEDDLVCRIVHLNRETLSTHPDPALNHYSAVSYVWGLSNFSTVLFCEAGPGDRTVIKITPNVEVMLRRFRKTSAALNLWIDAICLNQNDRDEIQQQLLQIGCIFESCEHTRIWLGDEFKEASTLFRMMRWIALNPAIHGNAIIHKDVDLHRPDRWSRNTFWNTGVTGEMISPDECNIIRAFFQNPWFSRRWVLQEFYSSISVTFYCHKSQIIWTTLNKAVRLILSDATVLSLQDPIRSALTFITNQSNEKGTLLDLLWHHHRTKCTDPRDMIFALVPLTEYHMMARLSRVHYDQHAHEICFQVAKMFITSNLLTTVLDHALAFGRLQDVDHTYPSWVPNWAHARLDDRSKTLIGGPDWLYLNMDKEVSSGYKREPSFTTVIAVPDSPCIHTVQQAVVIRKFVQSAREPRSWSQACEVFHEALEEQGFHACSTAVSLISLIRQMLRKDDKWNQRWRPSIGVEQLDDDLEHSSIMSLLVNDGPIACAFDGFARDLDSQRPEVKELANAWYEDMCAHIVEFYAETLEAWQRVMKTHKVFLTESFVIQSVRFMPIGRGQPPLACLWFGIVPQEVSLGDFLMVTAFDLSPGFAEDGNGDDCGGARYNVTLFRAAGTTPSSGEDEQTVVLDGKPHITRPLVGSFHGCIYVMTVSADMDTLLRRPGFQAPERQSYQAEELPAFFQSDVQTEPRFHPELPTLVSSITIL